MTAAAAAAGTPFHDLARYVAIPRVTALRLSPDGSWLAAAVQTLVPGRKTYGTSIWRIPAAAASAGGPVRLTRSPDGENNPRFLPDGSCIRPAHHAPEAPKGPDSLCRPGGATPLEPPLRCAPRWPCPPTPPALAGPEARTRCAGYERLAVGPLRFSPIAPATRPDWLGR